MSGEQLSDNGRRRIATYCSVGLALIVSYFLMRGSDWQGSLDLHTIMEAVATVMALMVGLMALARFYSRRDGTILIIGVAFLGTGLLDGFHAVVTSVAFMDYFPSTMPSLVQWSWVSSRVFLSIMLFISWLVWKREHKAGKIGQVHEWTIIFSTGGFTLASFLFFAFVPLPRSYYPEFFFHKPEEFVPVIFFLAALWGYLHKGAWRNDDFDHWLVLSLIVGVVGQVFFMSFSGQLFDMEFDVAHILKKASYICVFAGLLISGYTIFLRETEAISALEKEVKARMRAQESLKRKIGELARSNGDLEQFASIAAHDLQEPLRKVLAFSDRLQSKYADKLDEQGLDYLNRMQQSANRMKTLIEDLLTFSRVATKGQDFIRTDLNQIARGVVSDMEIAIRETGATINFDDLPTIDADPLQMRQLFQNLISNALKYRRDDVPPDINVEYTRVKDEFSHADGSPVEMCQITVSDNGIGFEEEYAERIFGIFQRLHGRNEYKGSGIGLSICRKISDRHGGRIVAESRINEGSKFSVTLPFQHGELERDGI